MLPRRGNMIFSKSQVEYHPVMAAANRACASLSPLKFARWIAACPKQQPEVRLVQWIQDVVEFAAGNHKCQAPQSFMGRLGTITKRCSIVFAGVLGFTGAVYGISVGLEKTGEWLKIPYKCMIPQEEPCFGEPTEAIIDGVSTMVRKEVPCPIVEGPCNKGDGIDNTIADWSTKIGEWMVPYAKEGQSESLSLATYMLLPIYGVVAAPNWIATKVTEWKTERLNTEDLVSDGIKLGTALFERVEASWTNVTEQLAKQFSKEG